MRCGLRHLCRAGGKAGFGTQSLSDTTLAMVNPYSENTDTAKAVAQAISYDYADLLEKDTGYISARTDVADKIKRCCTSRCMKYMHSPTAMQSISGQMNFMSDIPFYCTISGKAKI